MNKAIYAYVIVAIVLAGVFAIPSLRPVHAQSAVTVVWSGIQKHNIIFYLAEQDGTGYFYHDLRKAAEAGGYTRVSVIFPNPAMYYEITFTKTGETKREFVFALSVHSIEVQNFAPKKLDTPVSPMSEVSSSAFGAGPFKDVYAYVAKIDGSGEYEKRDFNKQGFGVENSFGGKTANKIWYGWTTNYELAILYQNDSQELYTVTIMRPQIASFNIVQ